MATQNFQAIGPVAQLLLGKFSLLYLNSKILDKKSSHLLPLQLQQEVTLDNLINEIGLKCPVQEIILHFVLSKFIFSSIEKIFGRCKNLLESKKKLQDFADLESQPLATSNKLLSNFLLFLSWKSKRNFAFETFWNNIDLKRWSI